MDYGLAKSLAFASLLAEGTPIRFTGQDVERGTFSHRHLVFHDAKTGAVYTPIQHLESTTGVAFEIHNSPLSEYACLGFEYGYSVELPNALVLWEAQFGDFNNGAQIIIDQFIAAGHAKWNESSRLVMLLPHGYEGAGPEHSSARIERFLQLSAEGNVRIANCSTAAQYFHLLRWQAKSARAVPLVVFTPKSLLRMKLASGTAESLSAGNFQPVIDDPRYERDRGAVEKLVLCSGKIYYDLVQHESYASAQATRDRSHRAALAATDRRRRRADRVVSESAPRRLGPGRADEHGRARARPSAADGASARGRDGYQLRRPAVPGEPLRGIRRRARPVEQERIVSEALASS